MEETESVSIIIDTFAPQLAGGASVDTQGNIARQANNSAIKNIRDLSDGYIDDEFDGNDSDIEEQDPQIFVEAENLDSEEVNRDTSAQG
ncbi:hypothetical protein BG005_001707, partial [Podila minutissima]